jgi:UDP-glucose:(heptosyl)LPS alpha-1,3-glucosyltransferase
VGSPYRQAALDQALVRMLTSPERGNWRRNGIAFGTTADLYSLPQRAAEVILDVARKRTSA